jgi:hypothetical protein
MHPSNPERAERGAGETQVERVLSILAHFPGNWRVSAHDSSGNRSVDFGDVGRLRVALRAAALPSAETGGAPEAWRGVTDALAKLCQECMSFELHGKYSDLDQRVALGNELNAKLKAYAVHFGPPPADAPREGERDNA